MNPLSYPIYHLYLLQLEEFDVSRYWETIRRTGGKPRQMRKRLVWTAKIWVVFVLSIILEALSSIFVAYLYDAFIYHAIPIAVVIGLIFFVFALYNSYIYCTFATIVIAPFDYVIKRFFIYQATVKMKRYKQVKVIGIAGSYGKTTFKETLAAVLGQKFKVLKTPQNINTPLGISRLILSKLNRDTQIFIVEMGEYYQGDVEKICQITPPDIAVITGINEAHLERLGSLKTTIATIFEIAQNTKKNGLLVINGDDDLVRTSYRPYSEDREVMMFGYKNLVPSKAHAEQIVFHDDASGISFDLCQGRKKIDSYKVPFLGLYIVADIVGCFQIGRHLSLTLREIKKGLAKIQPVPHRLQPIFNKMSNVLVIDDSYNGNPDGVEEAISVLSQFDKRRKIYVTPGLVEAGQSNAKIHYAIGIRLSRVANVVVLIKNVATKHIYKGLVDRGFPKDKIIWFDTPSQAYGQIGKIVAPNDVVLFQNDWPDNYL